jgi:hypothetical protein
VVIPSEGIVLYAEKMQEILNRPHLHELAVKTVFCRRLLRKHIFIWALGLFLLFSALQIQ